MQQLTYGPETVVRSSALQFPEKNRSQSFLPRKYFDVMSFLKMYALILIFIIIAERWRVRLKGQTPDYVHASYADVSILPRAYRPKGVHACMTRDLYYKTVVGKV